MLTKSSYHLIHFPCRPLMVPASIILTLFLAIPSLAADSGEPVARVNGVPIYQSDLSCAVEASLAMKLSSQHGSDDGPGYETDQLTSSKTLNRLIAIELLYQESLKHRFHGIIEESEKRYQVEVKRLGGEDKLASALQCNNMSPEQFRKSIFRNLSIKRLLNEVVYSRIQIPEEKIREYYDLNRDRFRKPESVRISQILIRAPSEPDEEKWRQAENRAHTIYQDASTGTDFVRLARRHSEDPESANAGGDMGLIQKGNLQGAFDTIIFSMKAGSVTKPLRSHRGFHIIKIISSNPSSPKTFEEVRQHITTLLRREQARKMISELLSELKARGKIEILKSRSQE